MDSDAPLPSRSAVERAGKIVRQWWRNELDPFDNKLDEALAVIDAHRRSHYPPMTQANVSLRGFCDRMGVPYRVTQRLKRMDTIVEKVCERESGMNLGRMQDLGGCRVVVDSIDTLRELERRIVKARPTPPKVYDYVTHPRDSGYRAVHIVADYGQELRRPIEVQLRTQTMHAWADMVEDVSGMLGVNYKQNGDAEVQQWAQTISLVMEANELHYAVPSALLDEHRYRWDTMLQRLREQRH